MTKRTAAPARTDLDGLFRSLGEEIGRAVGDSMVAAVRESLPRLRAEAGLVDRRASSRAAKVSAALTRACPVPGCNRPGRGPRFSFLCEVHRDLPKAEREKYRVRREA